MGNDDYSDNNIAMKHRAKKESRPATSAGGSIIDITDTPDVAVWAKEVRRGTDRVEEPSKTQSITTKSTADEKLVDSASKTELASMANRDDGLTDEADISKNKKDAD